MCVYIHVCMCIYMKTKINNKDDIRKNEISYHLCHPLIHQLGQNDYIYFTYVNIIGKYQLLKYRVEMMFPWRPQNPYR